MKLAAAFVTGATVVATALGTGSAPVRTSPSADRLLVVISDLHFGVGRTGGQWNAMEDFRWLAEFQQFLDEVDRQAQGKTDLVIAGDAFELWQSLGNDCTDADKDFGCTEREALGRFSNVAAAHGDELRAIGAFARSRDNRVVFVPGNHDAALLFPAVAEAVVKATAGGPDRVTVNASGYWLSSDGLVLIEHGHQIGQEVNKFRTWPRPFLGTNPVHLERTWGEQFVQGFYNQYEAKYPTIDNVTEEGVGVRYAKEIEGWAGLSQAFGRFIGFYLTRLSWAQHVAALGSEGAPVWDLAAVRSQGTRFLAESLPSDDPLGRVARQPGARFGIGLEALSDDDLRAMCDARAQIQEYQREHGSAPTVSRCPLKEGTLGAVGQAVLRRSRSAILTEYLVGRYRDLKEAKVVEKPFKVYVYAHTHLADAQLRPMATSHPDWNPHVLNDGAWQRTVTPQQLEGLDCKVAAGTTPIQLPPETLPACYSAVLIRPYTDAPSAELTFWSQGPTGWRFAPTCQWTPPCP